jgi:hypothetical protein
VPGDPAALIAEPFDTSQPVARSRRRHLASGAFVAQGRTRRTRTAARRPSPSMHSFRCELRPSRAGAARRRRGRPAPPLVRLRLGSARVKRSVAHLVHPVSVTLEIPRDDLAHHRLVVHYEDRTVVARVIHLPSVWIDALVDEHDTADFRECCPARACSCSLGHVGVVRFRRSRRGGRRWSSRKHHSMSRTSRGSSRSHAVSRLVSRDGPSKMAKAGSQPSVGPERS